MRGRGIDFEHRFKTSRWAEDLLIDTLAQPGTGLLAKRFGLSRVRSSKELAQVQSAEVKEPDLIVFAIEDLTGQEDKLLHETDLEVLPRAAFDEPKYQFVFAKALVAIEVEFSPYKASEMKGRYWKCRDSNAWDRRPLKHAKPPVAPNIFVKEQDLGPLDAWQRVTQVPIIVAHIFDQEGFAYPLAPLVQFATQLQNLEDAAQKKLQCTTGIFRKMEDYNRSDAQGAAEKKPVFCITPAVATKLGDVTDVKVRAQLGVSSSQKYVSHVLFKGGRLVPSQGFLQLIRHIKIRL
jgi:hypothetical protein